MLVGDSLLCLVHVSDPFEDRGQFLHEDYPGLVTSIIGPLQCAVESGSGTDGRGCACV